MRVSLVIPAYNEEKHIGSCIESVLQSAPGRFAEIIVVDNASDDRTAEIAGSYPAVRVIRSERKGLTHARQLGLEAASGDLVAYIDADCRMDRQWLPAIEAHFARHPESVSLTGPIWYYDASLAMRAMAVVTQWITLPVAYLSAGYLVIGGNFVAKRAALYEAGGFGAAIRFYGEDADIARRLARVGPVHLRMHFAIATSARRLHHEGVVRTYWVYALNFFSHALFKRSLTHAYRDVRE